MSLGLALPLGALPMTWQRRLLCAQSHHLRFQCVAGSRPPWLSKPAAPGWELSFWLLWADLESLGVVSPLGGCSWEAFKAPKCSLWGWRDWERDWKCSACWF